MSRDVTTGRFVSTHGGRHEILYNIWCAMKERCNNPHNKRYERYGGRGITVCDEWQSDYAAFRSWALENGFDDGLTIDRINGNGNYSPNNCRWVTTAAQNRNYSRNHLLTYKGETLCLADMADKYGVNRATVLFRLKSGKSVEEALSTVDGRTTRWKKTISQNCMQST